MSTINLRFSKYNSRNKNSFFIYGIYRRCSLDLQHSKTLRNFNPFRMPSNMMSCYIDIIVYGEVEKFVTASSST